ncbi:MAG: PH domain-containing protein [Actinomycetes bacterium]|jgi:uncharacterized membrane protein YdbT with pleckstrin-like domain
MAFSPARHLRPDENVLISTRRHPVAWLTPLMAALVALIVAFVLAGRLPAGSAAAGMLELLGLATVPFAIWAFLEWYFDRFVITDGRVMLFHGIVARRVAMMPVLKVTDLTYEVPALGLLLRYCNLEIESAGQDQALRTIKYLPYPAEVYDVVTQLTHRPKEPLSARRGRELDEDD